MTCRECRVWQMAAEDHFCSWCGAAYLRFSARLAETEIDRTEFPPPVELIVRNESPTQTIEVATIQVDVPWVTPLGPDALPANVEPGGERRFPLEVNTFDAPPGAGKALIQVEVLFAGTSVLPLSLSTPLAKGDL